MIKVSELIGKPLIALASAERIGTVGNVLFDQKLRTAQYLKIYCDDETQPEFQFVAFRRVLHLESDACVVTDKDAVTFGWNTPANDIGCPINCACYNQSGKFFGNVQDVQLDGNQVVGIIIGGETILPEQILSYSESLLIMNDTGKPIKIVRKKITVPTNGANITAQIHQLTMPTIESGKRTTRKTTQMEKPSTRVQTGKPDTQAQAEQSAIENQTEKTADSVLLPTRVPPHSTLVSRTPQSSDAPDTAPYAFLLGKTLSRDLKTDDGTTFARENSPVTEDTIRSAKSAGKLVQLALYAD